MCAQLTLVVVEMTNIIRQSWLNMTVLFPDAPLEWNSNVVPNAECVFWKLLTSDQHILLQFMNSKMLIHDGFERDEEVGSQMYRLQTSGIRRFDTPSPTLHSRDDDKSVPNIDDEASLQQ
ncbi:hypothetical protein AB6A40_006002 [Gnathostoma spinigerum]|uniref:Uncharacterized protein n=1 Tax=Gnathostoma spinigerum TaxID=75299 RepID=A0ABD6EHA7_9BILA